MDDKVENLLKAARELIAVHPNGSVFHSKLNNAIAAFDPPKVYEYVLDEKMPREFEEKCGHFGADVDRAEWFWKAVRELTKREVTEAKGREFWVTAWGVNSLAVWGSKNSIEDCSNCEIIHVREVLPNG